MNLRHVLWRLFQRTTKQGARNRPSLGGNLSLLEDRPVPAQLLWLSTSGTGLWSRAVQPPVADDERGLTGW